jgi:hypothetical protein
MIVNFHTLEHIITFCDIESIYNLLLINKGVYSIYIEHKYYIDKIISAKILKQFRIGIDSNNQQLCKNASVNKQLCYLYKKNSAKFYCRIADHLIILTNILKDPELFNDKDDSNDNTVLFKYLLEKCVFKFWIKEKDFTNINVLSIYDVEYILTNGSIYMADILFGKFYIPAGIITQSIITLLSLPISCSDIETIKITKIHRYMKYFITKNFQRLSLKSQLVNPFYIFRSEINMYFHEILFSMIKYDRLKILESIIIFKRKYNLYVNYDKLVNYAVVNDNIKILKMLYREYYIESYNQKTNIENINDIDSEDTEYFNNYNYNNLKLSNETIVTFFENGSLKCLNFLLHKDILRPIGSELITVICEGITKFFQKTNDLFARNKKENLLRNSHIQNTITKMNYMSQYLSDNNKLIINKHLNILQLKHKIVNPTLIE